METSSINTYYPFAPVHPYDILEAELEARGISKKAFAQQIGMKPSNFSRMLSLRGELSSEMALKFEEVLDIPYLDWMRYQEAYLKDKRRQQKNSEPKYNLIPYDCHAYRPSV